MLRDSRIINYIVTVTFEYLIEYYAFIDILWFNSFIIGPGS